jgi:septal ring factor EnvC (AmiA/AmiB activator)
MRFRHWAIAGSLILTLAAPAWALETRTLGQGQPAPFPGELLDQEAATKAIGEIRDARALAAELETLKGALAAKDRENEALRQAVALSDQMVARFEKAMDAYDRTLTKSNALMERQSARIEQLENREKWAMFLGGLGLLIGVAIGAF